MDVESPNPEKQGWLILIYFRCIKHRCLLLTKLARVLIWYDFRMLLKRSVLVFFLPVSVASLALNPSILQPQNESIQQAGAMEN